MRFFLLALRKEEWPLAVKEIIRVVKPGGMIQLMEPDFKVSLMTCLIQYF
jgi:ubiquinone/menaquinone biosynthesis C-methylase UbiE